MSSPASTSKIVQFGVFELDLQRAELRKQGVKVKLQEQPLRVLQLLIENPGQIVGREQLRTHIWPADTFVEFDQGLYSAMARLRDVLGDSSDSPRFIETVARRGYRFIAPVTVPATTSKESREESVPSAEGPRAVVFRRSVVSLLAGLVGGALLLAIVFAFDIAGAREWLHSRTTPIRSIAVLPLENLSGDPEQEYFADGMTDELTTNLAHLSDLRVISRTSAMQYKNTKKTLPEIGRELNVGAIVEGSVVRSGARVRITVQLVDATSDRHIWAKNYERNLGDVLGLQSEVAEAIAGEINLRLTASEKVRLGGPRALNPQAYQLYLQGRYLMDRASKENLQQAVDYYRQSIELDPGFARAWVGLAEAYSGQAGMGSFLPEEEGWRKAREAIEQGLALDPSLAEAHAIMGEMQLFRDWNWQEANTSLQRAMALEPNDATVLQKKAWLDAILGRLEEALPLDRRAMTLDPLSESARSEFEAHAYFAGRMEEAAAAIHRTLELDRQAGGEHYTLALIELEKGHSTEALAQAQQEPDPVFRLQVLVLAYHALGQNGESDTALKELIDKVHIGGAFQIAEVYGFLGSTEQACKWLDSAYVQHDSGLPFVRVDRAFKKLERDPCYLALLKKMALAS